MDADAAEDTGEQENAVLHRGAATEIEEIHQYIYAGGKLLRETISDGTTTKTLDFTYDNVGMPYSLIYNNGTTTATYYYITNLQGDVMYLVDSTGVEVAAYDYDPYGKIISATGTMAAVNPLCYRGYYYDSETGFYYLQSRYYDPEICRFINGDKYSATATGFLGYNMFAYCNNNPIIAADYDGEWLNIVIGAVVGAAINTFTALLGGHSWDEVLVSAACGALAGGLTAAGLGALGGAVGSFIDSGYSNYKEVQSGKKTVGEAVTCTLVDTTVGMAFGAMGSSSAAEIAVSRSISNAGLSSAKKLLFSSLHPTVKQAAKKALKAAGKYALKTAISEGISAAVTSGISVGISKITPKIYNYYLEIM